MGSVRPGSVASFFSQGYAEAREKFLAALEVAEGRLVESALHPLRGPDGGTRARAAVEDACRICRTWGDGYGYLLVATGRAEAMVDPLMNRWDAAAVETVVIEAGGRFSDWQGRPRIDSGDGIATNGLVHDGLLRLLAG